MASGKTRRVRRFRLAGAVSVAIGLVLLTEAAAILWYGDWPSFLPPQLDAVGAFLSLFGARAKTFGGGIAAALMGFFLVCAGALELRAPRT
jgi:hypothetical protein